MRPSCSSVIIVSLIPQCLLLQCDWNLEFICGDQCVNIEHNICHCGNDILDYMNISDIASNICCNERSCSRDSQGNIHCPGIKQDGALPCGNQCHQTAAWGYQSYLCQDQSQCYQRIHSCQGKAQCDDQSDLKICSKYQETMKCEDNESFETCGEIPGAKYQNFGCKLQGSEGEGSFHCTNRQDKEHVLFTKPPVPLKQTNRGRNYNLILQYDENYVYCNESGILYSEIWDLALSESGRKTECKLLNEETLTLRLLFIDLALDFTFEMNDKFQEFYHDKLMQQLEDQCLIAPNAFQCGNSPYCIYENKICDGIANCPNGEDEDFETCQDTFSPYATIKCPEKDVFNIKIDIGATPCDGNYECLGDIDEVNCKLPDFYFIILLVSILIFTTFLAMIMRKVTVASLEPIPNDTQSWTQEALEAIHGKEQLKIVMHQAQNSKNSMKINQNFIQMELDIHNGVKSEMVCCIKNSLDSSTTAIIMDELEGQSEILKKIKNLTIVAKLLEHLKNSAMTKMVVNAASHTMDLAKDSLILIQISLSQGGISFILMQPTPYIKGMFYFLLGSILFPFILSTLRLVLNGPKVLFGNNGFMYWLAMVLCIPIYPIFLIMRESILVQASKNYKVSLNLLKDAKYHVSQFIQADLGLESHLQSVFAIVFLLLATSSTRTIVGFEVLFENQTTFYLPTKLALSCSILWSLYSCIGSHLKGISKRRDFCPVPSLITILGFTTISIGIRTFCYIFYLTPCFGLWNCLRHLQGEMYPYLQPYEAKVNVSQEMFHFGNAPIIPWSKITRWNYVGYRDAEPPKYTLYTYFTIEQYFFGLFGVLVLNTIFQIWIKKKTNPDVFYKLSNLDLLIHGISSCFIPQPMEDWDEEQGGIEKHQIRKDLVFKEMFASIILNFGFNALLLSPLTILAVNIFDRHRILVNSIGPFPEEIQAYEQIILMLTLSYGVLVCGTACQVLLYHWYNGKYHPFACILSQDQDNDQDSYCTAVQSLEDIFYEILYTE